MALGAVLGLAVSPAGASSQSIAVDAKHGPVPKRDGLVQRDVEIRFGNGSLRYRGLTRADAAGPLPLVAEKWGDYFFGLVFFRQNKNGGWNGWDFLRATITTADGKPLQPQRQHLGDIHLLERDGRMLILCEWPVVNTAGQAQGKLVVTFVQAEAQPQWMFVRIALVGTDATLHAVELSAYPGSAAATPPERERWVATPSGETRMINVFKPLPAEKLGAAALFNRFADTESGCFLVYDAAQQQAVEQRAVTLKFTPVTGSQAVTFALGGYRDAARESDRDYAIQMFMTEHASQALTFMRGIDWRPSLPLAQYDQLLADLGEFLPRAGTDAQKARYAQLKAAFDQARQASAALDILEAVEPLRQLKEELLESLLAQYR